MQANPRVVAALEQLKGLFFEQPDVRLSIAEAREFSGLDEDICDQLLGALVDVRFLMQGKDGAYQRRGPFPSDDGRDDGPRGFSNMAGGNRTHGNGMHTYASR